MLTKRLQSVAYIVDLARLFIGDNNMSKLTYCQTYWRNFLTRNTRSRYSRPQLIHSRNSTRHSHRFYQCAILCLGLPDNVQRITNLWHGNPSARLKIIVSTPTQPARSHGIAIVPKKPYKFFGQLSSSTLNTLKI